MLLVGETIKSIDSPRNWYCIIEFESGRKIQITSVINKVEYSGWAERYPYLEIKEKDKHDYGK